MNQFNLNQVWICSWNQPVLSNESKYFAQENTVNLWQSWNYESDSLTTTNTLNYFYIYESWVK